MTPSFSDLEPRTYHRSIENFGVFFFGKIENYEGSSASQSWRYETEEAVKIESVVAMSADLQHIFHVARTNRWLEV